MIALIPDIEVLVGDHLREDDAVAALDCRVAGRLPKSFTRPWIKVTQIGAPSESQVDHVIRYHVQLDCYAGSEDDRGQAQASLLARTARAALSSLRGASFEGVVVGGVQMVNHAHLPDQAFEPWRERYVVEAEITAHAQ